jgi:cyanophycin synthetase
MSDLADRLEVKGRRLVVAAMPGDRRDQDIRDAAAALAGHFDHYFIKPDDDRRGRGPMEVPDMLKAELLKHGVAETQISLMPDEVTAIDIALSAAELGDLLVVFADELARSWKQIIYFKKAEREAMAPAPVKVEKPKVGFEELLAGGDQLIRDERGVRLARGGGEEAD